MRKGFLYSCGTLSAVLLLGSVVDQAQRTGADTILNANDGSVTIDASRLVSVTKLDARWRFQPKGDPSYSDSAIDDSKWALVYPAKNRLLSEAHLPNILDGSDWSRLHVHLTNTNPNAPLGLRITTRGVAYEVFADGKQIGVARGFASGTGYNNSDPVMRLPAARDFVLAIHCFSGTTVRHYLPLVEVEIGPYEALDNANQLDRVKDFLGSSEIWVIGCISFACVPFGIALFIAQRDHREYLWLAALTTAITLDLLFEVAIDQGWLPRSNLSNICRNLCTISTWIICLEFVAELAGIGRRFWVRIIQGSIIVGFLALNLSFIAFSPPPLERTAIMVLRSSNLFACVAAEGLMLWAAFRRGRKECGIFLVPITLLPFSKLIYFLQQDFPRLFGKLWIGHIGWIQFSVYEVGSIPFLVGIVGIVVYRFIRVSKDEEIAHAEMEAARSVQQLLIPANPPSTPGFVVESVYLPAQQVGGDFFLLLPLLDGSKETTLLAVMGDVSGKGMRAAMVVSTIVGALRVLSSRRPGDILAQLNSLLVGHVSGFTTCCAVLVNDDGRVTMANAGNPSPYSDAKEVETLPGLPLGLVAGIAYEETSYMLKPGERLTFVSDGVIEATKANGKELFGFERTREISDQSAESIAHAASAFGAGAAQADDITVLTIRLD